ncbi:DUF3106 domain-containing protein [Inhella proteolytica]|uniref:DUF3106 domain-containing protein n=1 Tax=Inhella proteolytica TaxID=2795029 RepID=A0A931J5D0_9BURK|nr:DUF3106 domain-containing protein [Inhella proteolytica]MBH9577844.1 DUF3106 domain-containing protein [Inhella proteolytica]
MTMRGAFAGLALTGLLAQPLVMAQELPAPAPLLAAARPWNSLNAPQREALRPLAGQWSELDATTQEKWLKVAARYPNLAADEQQRLQLRMAEWSRLSPQERLRARIGWQDAKRVTAAERQAKWERYQALPQEERQALQERAAQRRAPAPQKPATPLLVQAGPGVSTVPLTQLAAKPVAPRKRPLQVSGLDPVTLLPKAPARAASAP